MRQARERIIAGSAGALALLIAGLILWAGLSNKAIVEQLIAEGRVVRGEYDDSSSSDTLNVNYVVDGQTYRTSVSRSSRPSSQRPLLEEDPVDVPRFGPCDALHVVYLPSDPGTARLRSQLKPGMAVYVAAGGLFAVIGIVFGLVAYVWPFRPFDIPRLNIPRDRS